MIHLFCCSSLECSSFVVGSLRHLVLSLLQSIAALAIESRARCLQMNAANIKKKKNTIDIAYASMPEVGFILLWAKIKYFMLLEWQYPNHYRQCTPNNCYTSDTGLHRYIIYHFPTIMHTYLEPKCIIISGTCLVWIWINDHVPDDVSSC